LFAYGPADAAAIPKPHHLLPDLYTDWFLPFWYRLTQVVLEKRPLNGRSSSKYIRTSLQSSNTKIDTCIFNGLFSIVMQVQL